METVRYLVFGYVPLCLQFQSSPTKANPEYKGKWYAPMIDNPEYKGEWAPRKIANPDYFEDLTPAKSLSKIVCFSFFIQLHYVKLSTTGWYWYRTLDHD